MIPACGSLVFDPHPTLESHNLLLYVFFVENKRSRTQDTPSRRGVSYMYIHIHTNHVYLHMYMYIMCSEMVGERRCLQTQMSCVITLIFLCLRNLFSVYI